MHASEEPVILRARAGIGGASRAARRLAIAIGFSDMAADEIALVAAELATNVVKHAVEGVFTASTVEGEGGARGICLVCQDHGPGLPDIEHAFGDGVSTAGTLGYGLGTVQRLMDEVDILSMPELERGTRITSLRWLRRERRPERPQPISFGAATRARAGSAVNGDAYLIRRWQGNALVAVFDGLGHGQFALRASRTARDYVTRHHDAPLDRIFAGANRACRGTRGVVMAVARFDLEAETMTFASIGNIEGRLRCGDERLSLHVRRGVVGLNSPPPRVETYPWRPGSLLVLHSDGLSTSWTWDENPDLLELPAMEAARRLFMRAARPNDDNVVVVARAHGRDQTATD